MYKYRVAERFNTLDIMFKFVVLCALAALASSQEKAEIGFGSFMKTHPKIDPRIVNGEPAELGQFPYQVSLQLKGPLASSHYCGGSIIAPQTIVTAGHCVTEVNIGVLQHIEIKGGLVSLANPGPNVQVRKVTRTVVQPDYPGGVAANDIAIHILDEPLNLNEFIGAIKLPTNSSNPEGLVTLSGWGSTSHTQLPAMPDKLQTVQLPIIPFEECLAAVDGQDTPLDESMVCTGPLTGGFGACSGDSGGPLVSGEGNDRTLIGVVSWGFVPCAQAGLPSVFTNPSRFLDFIAENTV